MVISAGEWAMIDAINAYRMRHNLAPLSISEKLMEVARIRCPHFSHTAKGLWVWQHAKKLGFEGACTDNIAKGHENGVDAVGDESSGWGDEREGHTVGHDMQMKGFVKIDGVWIDREFNLLGVAENLNNKTYIAIFGKESLDVTTTMYCSVVGPYIGGGVLSFHWRGY